MTKFLLGLAVGIAAMWYFHQPVIVNQDGLCFYATYPHYGAVKVDKERAFIGFKDGNVDVWIPCE